MRGSHLPHAKFSLQSIKFSLRYAMGIMIGMFLFASQVLIPENVKQIFSLSSLACVHARPLRYLDIPYLIRAHMPCTCTCDMHARHNITRLTNNANHVIMTSSAFTFHSCHIGMRWHDVIGVHET